MLLFLFLHTEVTRHPPLYLSLPWVIFMVYIEDICFFEVNTKYISSSELKTSEFSRVRSTSENYYVFNSRDEIYLVFTEKKQIFFLFYTMHRHFPMHKVGGENAKTKNFGKHK